MPLITACDLCGTAQPYTEKPGGERTLCKKCGNVLYPPGLNSLTLSTNDSGDPLPLLLDRDVFLLIRKPSVLGQRSYVRDRGNLPIGYVESPSQPGQVLFSVIIGFIAAVGFTAVFIVAGFYLGGGKGEPGDMVMVAGAFVGPLLGVLAGLCARPKVRIFLYRDESKSSMLLEIVECRRVRIRPRYIVRDSLENPICHYQTNDLLNVFRGQWRIDSPEGISIASVKEDWLALALLRRITPNILRLLLPSKSFTIRGEDGSVILGTYRDGSLALSSQEAPSLDSRMALGIAVLLHFGHEL